MTFKKGQSGNPAGRKQDKLVADALRLAAMEIIQGDEQKRTKLRAAAEKLVEKAVEGDTAAFKEIADRLDGKPAQAVTLGGDAENPLELSITGLMSRIDGRSRDITRPDRSVERPALAAKPPVHHH